MRRGEYGVLGSTTAARDLFSGDTHGLNGSIRSAAGQSPDLRQTLQLNSASRRTPRLALMGCGCSPTTLLRVAGLVWVAPLAANGLTVVKASSLRQDQVQSEAGGRWFS